MEYPILELCVTLALMGLKIANVTTAFWLLIICLNPLDATTKNYTEVTLNRMAIQDYIQKINPSVSSENRSMIADQLAIAGNTLQVDPKFVAAIIAVESRFNHRAYGGGAMGLGQLMPGTARTVGVVNPYSITQNATGTTKYVKHQLDYFKQDPSGNFALASYLQGPIRVQRQKGNFPIRVHRYITAVKSHYAAIQSIYSVKTDSASAKIDVVPTGNHVVALSNVATENSTIGVR